MSNFASLSFLRDHVYFKLKYLLLNDMIDAEFLWFISEIKKNRLNADDAYRAIKTGLNV